MPDLVRQRPRAGDEADEPSLKISPGMIPTFALPGESTPGQFGPIIVMPFEADVVVDAEHLVRRDMLGDAMTVPIPASTAS